ncbi:MAG: hypothetical protein ACOC56_04430 [Atribacterota bacterium]
MNILKMIIDNIRDIRRLDKIKEVSSSILLFFVLLLLVCLTIYLAVR